MTTDTILAFVLGVAAGYLLALLGRGGDSGVRRRDGVRCDCCDHMTPPEEIETASGTCASCFVSQSEHRCFFCGAWEAAEGNCPGRPSGLHAFPSRPNGRRPQA